jgi:hypothetical protein
VLGSHSTCPYDKKEKDEQHKKSMTSLRPIRELSPGKNHHPKPVEGDEYSEKQPQATVLQQKFLDLPGRNM